MVTNILITGGAGYIGSHIVEILVGKKKNIYILDNLSTGHRKLIHKRAKFFFGDIKNQNLTKKILKNFNQNQVKILSEKIFEGSTLRRCPDVKKLSKLGFTPRTNIDKGLKKTIEWSKKL